MMDSNITIKAFGYPDTVLKEYKYWTVLLRPDQVTIGSVVIANKSNATYLGEVSEAQWSEFSKVSREVELALINTFGAEKFNYLALMMKDPNVHFHVVPRYSKPVTFENATFEDKDWPLKTELKPIEVQEGVFDAMKVKLAGAMS